MSFVFACIFILSPAAPAASAEQVVNIYSARHYESDKELYALFEKQTGIKVNVVSGNAPELIERIKREGDSTQADLFITVDGGILHTAKESGILQPASSAAVLTNVPAALRDKENYWVGLTTRARVIVYAKDRVKPAQLSTYEDMALPQWKGKVVVRPSSSLYDQSLLASLIALNGEKTVLEWVKGMAANFARPPKGNDRGQAMDIVAGLGDISLMNTYYIGQMLNSKNPEEVKAAQKVGVFFPNQKSSGTHINVSGIALTKHAKNKDNAVKFMEFFTSVPAQEQLSAGNYEFPANPKAKKHPLLESWGAFKTQNIDFSVLGANNAKAVQLAAEGGWK
ncbi:MAG: Fe(3+) ABC transporter substrate-binding protein [Deltaproteobacteria bacterium]|nr:Fe(3+) ABC transporter substrate-binding protein [Deltaproteobacteria bacterium]